MNTIAQRPPANLIGEKLLGVEFFGYQGANVRLKFASGVIELTADDQPISLTVRSQWNANLTMMVGLAEDVKMESDS